jgi:hypothetical protein
MRFEAQQHLELYHLPGIDEQLIKFAGRSLPGKQIQRQLARAIISIASAALTATLSISGFVAQGRRLHTLSQAGREKPFLQEISNNVSHVSEPMPIMADTAQGVFERTG